MIMVSFRCSDLIKDFCELTTICLPGECIRKDLIPPDLRITETVTLFQGEEKQQFLDFVSKMLQWQPEKRSTAKDLLNDPFLQLEDEAD